MIFASRKILTTISVSVMLFVNSLFAQDVHFSQFDAAPLYFNPALTGLFDCNNRIITNFKGQWSTYNSFMISYDQPIKNVELGGGTFGIGALVNADYAGETSYGNTLFKLLPAFHKDIFPGKLKLSTGLDLMVNYNSIDETKVLLPDDINPNTGGTNVGAEFENPSRIYADLGLGFNFLYSIRADFPLNAGITFNRLLGAGGGGIATNDVPTNYRKYSLNANAVYPINSTVSLLPSFIFLNQKKYMEMNAGSYVKFNVGQYTPIVDALYAGSWYRVNDAVIFGVGFDKPVSKKWTLNFGFSYDLTVSNFRKTDKWQTTNNVGTDSFEFSIKLINCKIPMILNPEGIINDPFR